VRLYARNITNRKHAEEALRESERDLNRAQAVAQIGSWRLDVRLNQLLWSDETHRIFGIPKGMPMAYETFLSRVHPEEREYVDRKWTAALRGEPYDIEHRIIVGDEVKWVRERAELELDAKGSGYHRTQASGSRLKRE
jgi:PAS domain-containing protein